jgi:A/G-specific adenine glycosylase
MGHAEGGRMLSVPTATLEEKKFKLGEEVLIWAAGSVPRYPWRRPGTSAYHVLVGEVWLARTPPPIAIWVYHCLLQRFPSLHDLAQAEETELNRVLSCFGLEPYIPEITALAERLESDGRGELPGDSESLGRISGLRKPSIQAIMCFGFGLPVAVIDANVARMLGRILGKTLPLKESSGLLGAVGQSLLPAKNPQLYNRGLLELAETMCTIEDPGCPQCPAASVCDERDNYFDNRVHNQGRLPGAHRLSLAHSG